MFDQSADLLTCWCANRWYNCIKPNHSFLGTIFQYGCFWLGIVQFSQIFVSSIKYNAASQLILGEIAPAMPLDVHAWCQTIGESANTDEMVVAFLLSVLQNNTGLKLDNRKPTLSNIPSEYQRFIADLPHLLPKQNRIYP